MKKKRFTKAFSLEEIGFKELVSYRYREFKDAKNGGYHLEAFKDGDIVKLAKVRPRNKKWLRQTKRSYRRNLYRVVKANDAYGLIIRDADYEKVKAADKKKIDTIVNGYTLSDVWDLDYFIAQSFPEMIDKYLASYKEIVSSESHNYQEIIDTLTNLRDYIKEESAAFDVLDYSSKEEIAKYEELKARGREVWGKFGEMFHYFWV